MGSVSRPEFAEREVRDVCFGLMVAENPLHGELIVAARIAILTFLMNMMIFVYVMFHLMDIIIFGAIEQD